MIVIVFVSKHDNTFYSLDTFLTIYLIIMGILYFPKWSHNYDINDEYYMMTN